MDNKNVRLSSIVSNNRFSVINGDTTQILQPDKELEQMQSLCAMQRNRIALLEATLRRHKVEIPANSNGIAPNYAHYRNIAEQATREYHNLLKEHRTIRAELCLLQGKQHCAQASIAIASAGGPLVFEAFAARILALLAEQPQHYDWTVGGVWDEAVAFDRLYALVEGRIKLNAAKLKVVADRLIEQINRRFYADIKHPTGDDADEILLAINSAAQAISASSLNASIEHLPIE